MRDSPVSTIAQVKSFLQLDREFMFEVSGKKEKYLWVEEVLRKFRYLVLKKSEKSLVRNYIAKITQLSVSQLTRLIVRFREIGKLMPWYGMTKRNGFRKKYFPCDVARLIETDCAHDHLSGEATQRVLRREYGVFGKKEYQTISGISVSHLYNIRNENRQYNSSQAKYLGHTRATKVNIGVRAKPRPQGKPGFLRVDTVHQGDRNGIKGVYHINIVDEVTQWEMIATVEQISEQFLAPVIEELILCFPFVIHEFHSDNGSEFINQVVARLLAKLYIKLTKSRARYSNDNALVESKNGSVIRKLYGSNHIPAQHAKQINQFNRRFVNTYLNYHRPCGFATDVMDKRGKIKKRYDTWVTPYEKFKSLPDTVTYLKPQISFADLEQIAQAMSDNECAAKMQKEKQKLFQKLKY